VVVILDTNAVSGLLAGDPDLGKTLAAEVRHHLPIVVIGEYRYGLLRSRLRKRLEKVLATLIRESVVLSLDETTATHYAIIRNELRSLGRPIPENDIWIAALARQHGQTVVSRDRHFDYVPDLVRRSW
jgi:predicted nucleic acid-binding protein